MSPLDEKQQHDLLLRAAAERQIDNAPLIGGAPAHPDEKLLSELHVHQIELEMQNEALRVTQRELEASRDRYVDLYDFAPVGYLTLNSSSMIEELNLTAAALLGLERKALLHRSFTALVVAADQNRWMTFFLNVMKQDGKGSTQVTMQRREGTLFQALLDCERTRVGADGTALRIVMTDISRLKAVEAAQLQQINELERFNRVAVGRELEMIGLKRQVNALSRQLGQTEPFNLDFAAAPDAETTPPLPASAEGA